MSLLIFRDTPSLPRSISLTVRLSQRQITAPLGEKQEGNVEITYSLLSAHFLLTSDNLFTFLPGRLPPGVTSWRGTYGEHQLRFTFFLRIQSAETLQETIRFIEFTSTGTKYSSFGSCKGHRWTSGHFLCASVRICQGGQQKSLTGQWSKILLWFN